MSQEVNSLGEGNLYSTEFRMFDPRLGRWMSLDPLLDQFPWMSPFAGMDNNPISLMDPLGLSSDGGESGQQEFTLNRNGRVQVNDEDRYTNQKDPDPKKNKKSNKNINKKKKSIPSTNPDKNPSDLNNPNFKVFVTDESKSLRFDISIENTKIKDVIYLQNAPYNISEKYLDLKEQIKMSTKTVQYLENQMYTAIDNDIIHTDDDAYRKTTKISMKTTGGGKRSGMTEGEVGYKIGKSIVDYKKYEIPLRIEQKRLKKLLLQMSLLKLKIDNYNSKKDKNDTRNVN